MENRRDNFEKELKELMKKYDVSIDVERDLLGQELRYRFVFRFDYLKGDKYVESIDVLDFWRP